MAELDRAAISVRLAEAREQAGLSQAELGDLLHLHFRSIQNYESPKVDRIPWDKLDEWGQITGRTKEWLLHGSDDAVSSSELTALHRDLEEVKEGLARVESLLREAAARGGAPSP